MTSLERSKSGGVKTCENVSRVLFALLPTGYYLALCSRRLPEKTWRKFLGFQKRRKFFTLPPEI